MAAAVAGALISGAAMYGVGARAQDDARFVENPALVQTVGGQNAYVRALQPRASDAAPVRIVRTAAPPRTVYRQASPEPDRTVVYREEAKPARTKTKTALIIGGSAASGAGIGGIVGGKKGALIGAALGGGAASIYEATRRR
jgi:hypothetical protein